MSLAILHVVQEGVDRPTSLSGFLSRPSSRNSFGDSAELFDGPRSGASPHGLAGVQSRGTAGSYSLASGVSSSLSRSTTPEPKVFGRSPISGLPPVGSRLFSVEQKNVRGLNIQNGHSSGMNDLADIAANLSGLSLSNVRSREMNSQVQSQHQLDNNSDFLFRTGHNQNLQQELMDQVNAEKLSLAATYVDLARQNGMLTNRNASKSSSNMQANFPKRTSSSANLYTQVGSSGFGGFEGPNFYQQNPTTPGIDFRAGAFPVNLQNASMDGHLDTGVFGVSSCLSEILLFDTI